MHVTLKSLILTGVCGSIGLISTSCFDDKYDLSDIDTTVRVDVNDLVIPINIDEVNLKDLIDIKPDDRLQIIDGKYCIIQDGSFNSSEIVIDPVHLSAPVIPSTTSEIQLKVPAQSSLRRVAGDEFVYPLHSDPADFHYAGTGNEYVTDIDEIYGEVTFTVKIDFSGINNIINGMELRNLVIQMPKGLTLTANHGGDYNSETGLLTFSSLLCNASHEEITLNVSAIDFKKMGGVYSGSQVSIDGALNVESGNLVLKATDLKPGLTISDIPQHLSMINHYTMSPINVNLFSGKIRYDIKDINIDDINLSDLPDAITGEGTKIVITNPQLYLSVTNPLYRYDLKACTGLTYVSHPRYETGVTVTGSLDYPNLLNIYGGTTGNVIKYCLSPERPSVFYGDYQDAEYAGFSSLSNVLDCETSVPSRISVHLDNPAVPEQTVTRFELGVNLGEVIGSYTFLAPLSFNAGSKVSYSDVLDGWSSDDLDYLTVKELVINLTVDSDLPLGITLTGSPIDKFGNTINGVVLEGANIQPNAKSQNVSIRTTGEFSGVDGVRFTAVVAAGSNEAALSPEMGIKLSNIRPRVNGYYQKEL